MGNNGTTLTGGVIANREGITWKTKEGVRSPNFWGSLTQASTCRVGAFDGEEVHAPFKSLLPMVDPADVVFDGWDISGMNLADAMERAQVLDWDLQRQLAPAHASHRPPRRDLRPEVHRREPGEPRGQRHRGLEAGAGGPDQGRHRGL